MLIAQTHAPSHDCQLLINETWKNILSFLNRKKWLVGHWLVVWTYLILFMLKLLGVWLKYTYYHYHMAQPILPLWFSEFSTKRFFNQIISPYLWFKNVDQVNWYVMIASCQRSSAYQWNWTQRWSKWKGIFPENFSVSEWSSVTGSSN